MHFGLWIGSYDKMTLAWPSLLYLETIMLTFNQIIIHNMVLTLHATVTVFITNIECAVYIYDKKTPPH